MLRIGPLPKEVTDGLDVLNTLDALRDSLYTENLLLKNDLSINRIKHA